MRTLDHERVVTLSADDLASLLEAIGLAGAIGMYAHFGAHEDELGRMQGIIEQLRGKFNL